MTDEWEGKKKRDKRQKKRTKESLSTKLRTLVLWSKKQQEKDLIVGDRQREGKSRGDKTQ